MKKMSRGHSMAQRISDLGLCDTTDARQRVRELSVHAGARVLTPPRTSERAVRRAPASRAALLSFVEGARIRFATGVDRSGLVLSGASFARDSPAAAR